MAAPQRLCRDGPHSDELHPAVSLRRDRKRGYPPCRRRSPLRAMFAFVILAHSLCGQRSELAATSVAPCDPYAICALVREPDARCISSSTSRSLRRSVARSKEQPWSACAAWRCCSISIRRYPEPPITTASLLILCVTAHLSLTDASDGPPGSSCPPGPHLPAWLREIGAQDEALPRASSSANPRPLRGTSSATARARFPTDLLAA